MVRRAWVETRSFTQRFSLGTQKRRSCRFGSQRRRVLLLACDTLLPDCARLPVTWQTFAIRTSSWIWPPLARAVAASFVARETKGSPEQRSEPLITTESGGCSKPKRLDFLDGRAL